ncbi:MAG TPA: acyl carrier protein, partial [Myxococcales bacterium]|nr:acyl carrier protein [Myxococcales bacterium]
DLPVTVMFDNPTIGHLAEHLASLFETGPDQAAAGNMESMENMLTELENLSEEEVERRLRKGH